jgi:aromatic ring-cleaving dioxygenase
VCVCDQGGLIVESGTLSVCMATLQPFLDILLSPMEPITVYDHVDVSLWVVSWLGNHAWVLEKERSWPR